MRSKDLAKAAGLAVAFDHTAPTFYRVSPKTALRAGILSNFLGDDIDVDPNPAGLKVRIKKLE